LSEKSKFEKRKTIVATVTTLLVALFSPVGIILMSHPYGEFAAHLVGVFWSTYIGSPIPIDGGGMVPPTLNPVSGILVIPLIILRLLFVLQVYRAYSGKTSRGAAITVGVVSELFIVIINLLRSSPTFTTGDLYIPIPILLLVGYLFLWRFPPYVPSTPWETPEESDKSLTPSIDGTK